MSEFGIYIPKNLSFEDYIAIMQTSRVWADGYDNKVREQKHHIIPEDILRREGLGLFATLFKPRTKYRGGLYFGKSCLGRNTLNLL